uniref:Hypothetical polypeptide 30A n=1 Tax=Mesocricetus auratus TaxID=10036 RepID=Q6RVE7_MESAU|nr:hypothetical polypeptide 30A [Mesocricetus auratus]
MLQRETCPIGLTASKVAIYTNLLTW